jgi:hypothetical protein
MQNPAFVEKRRDFDMFTQLIFEGAGEKVKLESYR